MIVRKGCHRCFNCLQRTFRNWDEFVKWLDMERGMVPQKRWYDVFHKNGEVLTVFWCKVPERPYNLIIRNPIKAHYKAGTSCHRRDEDPRAD